MARLSMRVIVRRPVRKRKWTSDRRLRVALANNNAGRWYVALSRKTVVDLERRFYEGSVGRILFDVTGGILGDHVALRQEEGRHYIYIQLTKFDGDVGLCLSELGVQVLDLIAFSQIRHY